MRLLITYLLIAFISSCGGDSGGGDPAATEDEDEEEEEEEHEQVYKDRIYELVSASKTTSSGTTTITPSSSTFQVEMTFKDFDETYSDKETYTFEFTGMATFSNVIFGSYLTSQGCTTGSAIYDGTLKDDNETFHYVSREEIDDSCSMSLFGWSSSSIDESSIEITSSRLIKTEEWTTGATYVYEFEKL